MSTDALPSTLLRPPGKKGLWAWALYDWANSAFPTVVITFVFATYFAEGVVGDSDRGASLWGLAMSISGVAVAILAPIVGAVADHAGRRKPWLALFTVLALIAGAGLWFVKADPAYILLGMVLAGLANLAFEFGTVFYNAMLPDLVPPKLFGRLSGWAWGLGYAGGLGCLAVAYVFVTADPPPFGLDPAASEPVRAVGPLVALWYLLFAWPLFLFTPDRPAVRIGAGQALRQGLAQLGRTLRGLRHQTTILRFLIARLFYTDGHNTLFAFGGIYAARSFGMAVDEILLFGILLNVTAGLGAVAFGWVDDWIGAKPTIVISLVALLLLSGLILLAEGKLWFYVIGSAIGIFIGPAQSASRSLMAHLAPPAQRTEMFGLFALTGKVTAFLGPALVTVLTAAFDSLRVGMTAILILFLLGLVILWPLKAPPPAK
jgi:UMF1 family MFS transporter